MSDIEIIKSVLAANSEPPMEPAGLDLSRRLSEIGIDSLRFMLVVIEIEQKLGRPLFDVEEVGSIVTVEDLVNLT